MLCLQTMLDCDRATCPASTVGYMPPEGTRTAEAVSWWGCHASRRDFAAECCNSVTDVIIAFVPWPAR